MAPIPDSDPSTLEPPVLARRLELLLDVVWVESGRRASYKEIAGALADRGLHLNRARWQYMLAGTHRVPDTALLTAIADFFQVSPTYLLQESGDLPERIESQLELLRVVRQQRLKVYLARQLGELNPEQLHEMVELINRSTPPPSAGASPDSVD